MDYTGDPDGTIKSQLDNQHPNAHDLAQLETIYAHLDSTNTALASPPTSRSRNDEPGDGPADWGRAVGRDGDGRANRFERDLGNGQKKLAHVFWAR